MFPLGGLGIQCGEQRFGLGSEGFGVRSGVRRVILISEMFIVLGKKTNQT